MTVRKFTRSAGYGGGDHIAAALSTFAAGYTNGDYIADHLSPIVLSEKLEDFYKTFTRKDSARQVNTARGPKGQPFNRVNYDVGSTKYRCEWFGLADDIAYTDINNSDEVHNVEERTARHLTDLLLLDREIRVATKLMTAANYATANQFTASDTWDSNGGDPLDEIRTARRALAPGRYGESKIVAACSLEVWHALSAHPKFLAYKTEPVIDAPDFLRFTGIDELWVSDLEKDAENVAVTPGSFSRVWDSTKFCIVRVPREEPTGEEGMFSATMRFKGDLGGGVDVRRWDNPELPGGGYTIASEIAEVDLVIQDDQGAIISSVLS